MKYRRSRLLRRHGQQPYPYQSNSSDCTFKYGTKRILFRRAVLAEGLATFRKLLKDYFRITVENDLRFPEVDVTGFTALLRNVYGAIDDASVDETVWQDKRTLLPHARVYILARECGLPALQQTACDRYVRVLRKSRDPPSTPARATDLLTSIKEIFAGTTPDDNEIHIWLIRYCTYHIRELLDSHTYRDTVGEIMTAHGALSSSILLLQNSDSIDMVTIQTCLGCRFRWVADAEYVTMDPRDWCRNCEHELQPCEDSIDGKPNAVICDYLQDPIPNWLDDYSDAGKEEEEEEEGD